MCICGTILCYSCGKIINGYDHFEDNKCVLWSNQQTYARVPVRQVHEVNKKHKIYVKKSKYFVINRLNKL